MLGTKSHLHTKCTDNIACVMMGHHNSQPGDRAGLQACVQSVPDMQDDYSSTTFWDLPDQSTWAYDICESHGLP